MCAVPRLRVTVVEEGAAGVGPDVAAVGAKVAVLVIGVPQSVTVVW